jgi:hypothetical protein
MTKMPRDFLSDKDLIGFVRVRRGDQVAERASSAKVTEPPDPAREPSAAAKPAKPDK